ncbi:MAG: hypothetical protein H6R07_312 [Proteobacteria bacterium]|nr:hypothetical protein [Pseudomonadota bacterium]
MATPQSGILPDANQNTLFLLFRRRIGRRASHKLKTLLAHLPERAAHLASEDPAAHFSAVVAFGPTIWNELWEERPHLLHPFPRIAGAVHQAPSTDTDMLLHLRSERYDFLHEFADKLVKELSEWLDLLEVVHGFRYQDGRDLTGFVDGTGNPEGDERAEVALVGEEDPDWAGGSYVHVQRFVHRMDEWNKLPVKQQEAIIGRSKHANIEMDKDDRPLTSHMHRVNIENGSGKELKLLRHSMPYGIPGGERGLYFCSYCRDPAIFEKMLSRMVAPIHDGRVDHLLNFTRAVSGAAFFAPSVEKLQSLDH